LVLGFGAWCLVAWYLVLGSLVLGAWCLVAWWLGAWCLVLGAWCFVLGFWCSSSVDCPNMSSSAGGSGSAVTLDQPTRLFQIYKTITQMLKDRGYMISASAEDISKEEFLGKYWPNYSGDGSLSREPLMMVHRNKNDPTDQIFVFFPDEPKVGVKPIRKYCDKMKEEKVQRAIIIVKQAMTAFAKQALAEMAPLLTLEHFQETELLVNITQHQLVPRHILLSREEKQVLLDRYKLKESQLPRIQHSDPVARYYGLQRGQVGFVRRDI